MVAGGSKAAVALYLAVTRIDDPVACFNAPDEPSMVGEREQCLKRMTPVSWYWEGMAQGECGSILARRKGTGDGRRCFREIFVKFYSGAPIPSTIMT